MRKGLKATALLSLGSASVVQAATFTYEGTGSVTMPATGNFSGPGFSPTLGTAGGIPVSTTADTLIFGGGTTYAATDDFGATVNANVLTFSNTAAISLARGTSNATGANSFTLGSTNPTINLNNTSGTGTAVTNNLDLILGANATITGVGYLTQNGVISDGGNGYGVNFSNTGYITLASASTYTGTTSFNGTGRVMLNATNAISSSSTVVFGSTNRSYIQLNASQTVASISAVADKQSTFVGNVANVLLTVGGDNTTQVFNGQLYANATNELTLVKNGTGTLTLGGSEDNTRASLTVNAGEVILNKPTNSGDTYHAVGGFLNINNSATVQLGTTGADQIFDSAVVTMSGGTFDLNGQAEIIGGLASTGTANSTGNVTNTATGAAVLTVGGSTATSTFAGTITDGTGTMQINKENTGIQIFSGTNTYSGGTNVSVGVLELGTFASLPSSGTGTSVAAGATLAVLVGGTNPLTVANANTYLANATFAAGSMLGFDTTGGNFTNATSYSGTYGLNKLGANILTLTGANTYTGPTTITAGTLAASGAAGALSTGSAVNMAANTVLSIRNDASGTIAQSNSITLTSAGGSAGTTTIDVRNNGGATTGSVVALGALNNGTVASAAYNNAINFTGANGYTLSFTSLALPGAGGTNTYLNPTTTSVTIGSVINQLPTTTGSYDPLSLNGTSIGNVITGVIADSPNHPAGDVGNNNSSTNISVNPTVTGLGTTSVWTFTGANTYSGTTFVANGGALILNTPSTSTAAGTVNVNSGGTLLGNGYAPTGVLTVASGANLAPGASATGTFTTAATPGILHVGALTLNTTAGAGSNFNVLLNDNASTTGAGAGTDYSQLVASSVTTLAGNLNLTVGNALTAGDKFFILVNSSSTLPAGTFSNIGVNGTSFTSGGDTFTINYADNFDGGSVANDISLTVTGVTAVPEPSTWVGALLSVGILGFVQCRKVGARLHRRRRS